MFGPVRQDEVNFDVLASTTSYPVNTVQNSKVETLYEPEVSGETLGREMGMAWLQLQRIITKGGVNLISTLPHSSPCSSSRFFSKSSPYMGNLFLYLRFCCIDQ